jgi:hypothetical protein
MGTIELIPIEAFKNVNSKEMNSLNIDIMDQITISDFANGDITLADVHRSVVKIMVDHHIDFQGLIPQGLAVEKIVLP